MSASDSANLSRNELNTPTEHTPRRSRWLTERAARTALISFVVFYALVLRFDAIAQVYGPVTHPHWLASLQEWRAGESLLRPAAFRWEPAPMFQHREGPPTHYRSDPYTYLQYARDMRSFYAAHRREPVFPFITRVFLIALGQQDYAVSFASATSSVLVVLATYWLGARAFSVAVGLMAAMLLAIEYDVISWSAGGWRDDAFTFSFVVSLWAMLRCARQPSVRNALLLGGVAGLACLTRITALSFLLPGLPLVMLGMRSVPLKQRLLTFAVAALTAILLVAPYMLNCWRVFGDPLYAINVHADVYRATEGQDIQASQTASQYVAAEVHSRPVRTLDTFLLGMTEYPFANKWRGFDRWAPVTGSCLACMALLGLLLFTTSFEGWLLLTMYAASLIPFAFTWRLLADWRFTEHVYPLLLIAASVAGTTMVRALTPAAIRTLRARRLRPRDVVRWTALPVGVVLVWFGVTRWLPILMFEEALHNRDAATIMAGDRDSAFFLHDWPRVSSGANVSTRITDQQNAVIRVPLPDATGYDATIRLDAAPLDIFVNGTLVARCDPGSTPERMGGCRFRVPGTVAKRGFNRLLLAAHRPGLKVWYVRLQRSS